VAETEKYKATVRLHNGVWDYCSYWDKVVEECLSSKNEYADYIKKLRADNERNLRGGGDPSWYGSPVPLSVQDAMDRREYLNKELFERKYLDVEPFLQKLEKISNGIIPKPVITPNDKQLGSFSLDRALMAPVARLCLWSNKHKKEFELNEGVAIYEKGAQKKVKIKLNNSYKGKKDEAKQYAVFSLKEDGSEAYLTQKVNSANDRLKWSSRNKKSFLFLDKLPRLNRSIRLFVLIGGNCGRTELYWAGIVGIIVARYLSSKGYAIRITGCVGIQSQNHEGALLNFDGKKQFGYRIDLIDVKPYSEELNLWGMLYPLADASFFRVRCFDYFTARYWQFKDDMDTGLGRSIENYTFENIIHEKIKSRHIEQEKDTLYYFVGGDDVTSQAGAERNIARIIYCAEMSNRQALINLGHDFEPLSPNEEKEFEDLKAKYGLDESYCLKGKAE
jgi:hypothetical protein